VVGRQAFTRINRGGRLSVGNFQFYAGTHGALSEGALQQFYYAVGPPQLETWFGVCSSRDIWQRVARSRPALAGSEEAMGRATAPKIGLVPF